MNFLEIAKSAIELGVVPTLALALVLALMRQNQDLLKDKKDTEKRLVEERTRMEERLLTVIFDIVADNKKTAERLYSELDTARRQLDEARRQK
ncbi:MAG TPA: hypothetical protein VN493_21195 [Thermoanaerobaculia bacterium]|nr:hypothetical protein [Thermoanaerobaculia bacterium]